MGLLTHSRTLGLWANGERIGRWTLPPRGDMELQYDPVWIASGAGRPLSLSLPFPTDNAPLTGPRVDRWFEGLLPDSEVIRQRAADRFNTGSTDPFDLLSAIGRDCAGAIQLLPDDELPAGVDRVEGIALDDGDIERHLMELVEPKPFPEGGDPDDDFRVALGGVQEKDAFLRWDGKWLKPRGSTPTTHIFKLPVGYVGGRRADFTSSVDNEWLCLRLLAVFGVPVAKAEIETFGSQRVLVVERFDRAKSRDGRRLLRRVQEDFCQATGMSPRTKYENEGGPGLAELFTLTQQSVERERDLRTLMAAQILFFLMRAPDGHAKNFSLQLMSGPGGRFTLTPLYDVMSALPVMGDAPNEWAWRKLKLAMAFTGSSPHYLMHGVRRRHINSTARDVGYGDDAEPLIQELIERTPAVVAQVAKQLPTGFSQIVADKILGGLLEAAKALEAMPAR